MFKKNMVSILLLLIISTSAFAGRLDTAEVQYTTNGFSGVLGSVRHSSDAIQSIGCSIDSGVGICTARNRAREFRTCVTFNSQHLEAIKAINDSSHITVRFDSNGGSCTSIEIRNYSYYRTR